ncbi:hypothetical protein ABRT01_03625 [Lentibacillus sp. L22]|uniref:hypothetical protein n=1 Tax=Lentibacillus sp. L22 TaxID=3163028 RepID=UPI0034651068
MILQILSSNGEMYKDVLCMDYEYDQFIISLELSRIPFKVKSDSTVEGMQHVVMSVEDVSTVNDYFY